MVASYSWVQRKRRSSDGDITGLAKINQTIVWGGGWKTYVKGSVETRQRDSSNTGYHNTDLLGFCSNVRIITRTDSWACSWHGYTCDPRLPDKYTKDTCLGREGVIKCLLLLRWSRLNSNNTRHFTNKSQKGASWKPHDTFRKNTNGIKCSWMKSAVRRE